MTWVVSKYRQHIHHQSCSGLNMSCTSLTFSFSKLILVHATGLNFDSPVSFPERAVSVINFEELMEKDWSVLDYDKFSPSEEFNRNIERIISAEMIEETSRVLVSISSEEFMDRLVDSSPCKFLLVVPDSLLMLAGIKEKYDLVKCWWKGGYQSSSRQRSTKKATARTPRSSSF